MVNFVDEYPRQLDERGRIICPPKLEKICPKRCTLHVQCQIKCLQLYTQEEWDKISQKD